MRTIDYTSQFKRDFKREGVKRGQTPLRADTYNPVIPAKAGIQGFVKKQRGQV